jgi:predicted transcriptional regulator
MWSRRSSSRRLSGCDSGDTDWYHAQMPMTLRLTPEETEALRETARLERRSMQAVARAAISEYVTRRVRRRDEHLTSIVAEDAELLRRLGSV